MSWDKLVERYKEHNNFMMEQIKEKNKELSELRKQNKRYREYLELIKTIGTYGKDISTGEIIRSNEANLAEEALLKE